MFPKFIVGVVFVLLLAGSFMVSVTFMQTPRQPLPPPTEWSKVLGGTETDETLSLVQTRDGGYAIAGYTYSFGTGGSIIIGGGQGQVHCDDGWLIKIDAFGNVQWNKTYGTINVIDEFNSLVQTKDGGYALAGHSEIVDDLWQTHGGFWLVKTDTSGNMEWNRTYQQGRADYATSLVQTKDDGFIVVGDAYANTLGAESDIWLVKTDSDGNMEWNRTFYGWRADYGRSVIQTDDGKYVVAGATVVRPSPSGKQDYDAWLVKTDANGNAEWNQTYGGTGDDEVYSVIKTSDGGYAIAGSTNSFGQNTDGWLIKVDEAGNMGWNKTYNVKYQNVAESIVQTRGGGYAMAGYVRSYGLLDYDGWLVKTDADGNMEWNKTYGGAGFDSLNSIVNTVDGAYAMTGSTESFSGEENRDGWLIKTSAGRYIYDVTWGSGMGDSHITIFCNQTVTSFVFDRSRRCLNFTLTAGDYGVCNVTVPRCRLDGPFNMTINGTLMLYVLDQNKTDSILSFSYVAGTHNIEVAGTEIGCIIGDMNGDGQVNIVDVTIAAMNFGHTDEDYP